LARTVLLADDSVTAQNMGRRILTDAGYEVITVNNGSAALKKVHESRPDLIVLDVYMPGYGGLEVCQRLKESGETMRIPVLLTVGKMEPFKVDEAKRVRADGHIVKPFEASELLAALAKLEDRIVPQDSGKGKKKDKKPSFWHGSDESEPPRDWTENVAYLAQAKQRKAEVTAEPEFEEPVVEVSVTKRASNAPMPDPAGELPVVAEPAAQVPEVSSPVSDFQPGSSAVKSESAASRDEWEGASEPVEQESPSKESRVHEPAVVASSGPRWVAQKVALTAEEAALELEKEMRAAEADVPAAAPAISATSAETSVGEPAATFAAAAAAGSASSVSAVASSTGEEEPQGYEAAAAWQNWQSIREAVMSAQAAGGILEKLTPNVEAPPESVASSSADAAPAHAEAAPTAIASTESVATDADSEGLSNIVDSVLAELKPKLMQEIAKKLKK
jgi:CheY-like chemotaxis protein